ncbi:tetratricopeptide repeat protein (plasmid) [Deinococcus sp. KNUC1210]|uniref:ATP-binding protein n=1 Tax=Deinococcus sp. KNUC1210 TaxID=2917691 RepID=UPI001EF00146|nr:tetratricopeptide repeat protein [Deinococcus sp. KNUC1210]ULH17157.1 tetratricopeptide repeat protein [Deinococcus sp. KNUC1210]
MEAFRAACAAGDSEAALSHYGGLLLLGVPFPPHQDFSEWLEVERAQLHAEYLRMLWQAVREREERGDLGGAVSLLRRAVQLSSASDSHTADTQATEILSELLTRLLRLNERAEARLLLSRFETRLRQDYGAPLPPALEAIAVQLQAVQAQGVDRLADARRLPAYLTTFVGRRHELYTALNLLTSPDPARRWLTLTGPGGIGKTRLATEVAQRYATQTGEEVLFTALAPLSSERQMVEALLLGLDEPLEAPAPPQERLLRALAGKRLLLVLDNFEHLMEAAQLVPTILTACSQVRILITSRERLDYQAESVLRLGGLDDEHGDEVRDPADAHARSARLFVERASRADASFDASRWQSAVKRIARRCAGLPLALELAAAWVGETSPDQLSKQLDVTWDVLHTTLRDLPERHRSLRAVFEYSWQALPKRLQQCYANLAVLRSPFGVQAAAQVADVSEADLTLLERRSLLTHSAGLYGWHENLREYALEQLGERLGSLQDRHLQYFVQMAEEAAPRLRGLAQVQTLESLAAHLPDLRSALDHALITRQTEAGLRLAGALHWFWYVRGHHEQGLEALNAALSLAQDTPSTATPSYALALRASGSLSVERGLTAQGLQRYEESLAVYQALGDVAGQAQVWHGRGVLQRDQGHYPQARTAFDTALLLWERCGDRHGYATTLNDLGILMAYQEDDAAARTYFQGSLELKREVGDVQGVAYALNNLSSVTDDLKERLRLDRESLRIKQELGDVQGCAIGHTNCGGTALQLGRPADAAQHFIQALGLIRHLGKLSTLPGILLEVSKLAQQQQRPDVVRTLTEAALRSDGQAGVRLRSHQRTGLERLGLWAAERLSAQGQQNVPMHPAHTLSEATEAALMFLNGHAVWPTETEGKALRTSP